MILVYLQLYTDKELGKEGAKTPDPWVVVCMWPVHAVTVTFGIRLNTRLKLAETKMWPEVTVVFD